jgi:hypothetical protein
MLVRPFRRARLDGMTRRRAPGSVAACLSTPVPSTYRTTNWRAYSAALKQRGSLQIWFDPEMEWLAAPSGRRGPPATFSDAAIQTCLMRDGRCLGCH